MMDNFSGAITMPGPIDKMAVIGDSLYVIVRFNRRWWQFWKPPVYRKLIELTAYDLTYRRSSPVERNF